MNASGELDVLFDILKDTNSFPFFTLSVGVMVFLFTIFLIFFAANKYKKFYHRKDIFFNGTPVSVRVRDNQNFWIFKCFFWTSDEIYKHLGIDSMILLKTTKMLLCISVLVSVLSLGVALPIHLIQAEPDKPLFIRVSLSVIVRDNKLLWVHFSLVYLFTFLIMLVLYFNWKDVVRIRQKLFADNPFIVCSLLFSDIVTDPEFETNESSISSKIRQIAGESEQLVEYTLRDVSSLESMLHKHDQMLRHYNTSWESLDQKAPIKTDEKGLPDAADTLLNETLLQQYEELRYFVNAANHNYLPAKILALSSVGLAQTFRCTPFSINETTVRVSLLPEPTAIIWHNLEVDRKIRFLHSALITLLTTLVIVFCSLPFILVAAITKSIYITDKHLVNINSSIFRTILQYLVNTIIPVLLVNTFIFLERIIFQKLSTYENHVSYTHADFSVFRKMCIFNALDTFFAFTFTTTIIDMVIMLIEHPMDISLTIALSIPVQSNFFMIYLAFQAFIMMPWSLLRANHYIISRFYKFKNWIVRKIKKLAPRKHKKGPIRPLSSEYVYKYSNLILMFGIGLVFSLLSPLISVVWIPFFVITYLFYAFEEERTNVNIYNYNGEFWPIISDCVIAYTVFMQFFMMQMFMMRKSTIMAFLTLPSTVIIVIFAVKIRSLFYKNFKFPSYDTMNKIRPLSLVEMHKRCKPYYIESFVPSLTETTDDVLWRYVHERSTQQYDIAD